MGEAYDKGKSLELKIASLIRKKLGAQVARDKRSGAGTNKSDITDYWRELPLHLEIKNHEHINIKQSFRQADAASSVGQAPTVVFSMDDETLACLRFEDLLNLLLEIKDNKAEIGDLRKPVVDEGRLIDNKILDRPTTAERQCRAGHLANGYGQCLQVSCKFSRGYKPTKKNKN